MRLFLLLFSCLLITQTEAQTNYTFNGNGLWSNAVNWSNNTVPPSILPSNSIIYISPALGDSCVLDVVQTLSKSSQLIISDGAHLVIQSGLLNYNSFAIPIVSTDSVYKISINTIQAAGKIFLYAPDTVIARGFVWSTNPAPTITSSNKNNLGSGKNNIPFTSVISNLSSNRKYYVRAYATNSYGTNYGKEISFVTKIAPSLTTIDASAISTSSAQLNGLLTNPGLVDIISKGFAIDTAKLIGNTVLNAASPYIPYTASDTFNFYSIANSLLPSTKYAFCAKTLNFDSTSSLGSVKYFTTPPISAITINTDTITKLTNTTATGSATISGDAGRPVIQKGLVWDIAPNATIDKTSKTNNGPGIGSFTTNIANLAANTTYYLRAYMITEGNAVYYGNEISFTTAAACAIPIFAYKAEAVSATYATIPCYLHSDGGIPLIESGLVYSAVSKNPSILDSVYSRDGSLGNYYIGLSGLTHLTVYYCRAYAKNINGDYFYSNVIEFLTAY